MAYFFILSILVLVVIEATTIRGSGVIETKLSKLQKDVTHLVATVDAMQSHLKDVHIHIHGTTAHISGSHNLHMENQLAGFHMGAMEAHCDLKPNTQLTSGPQVKGHIHMAQQSLSNMKVTVKLSGLPADNVKKGYALHVHEFNDTSKGCQKLGGHFNPHKHKHGKLGDLHNARHPGDWGNVFANENGMIESQFTDKDATLMGSHTIIGRSIVLHAKADNKADSGKPIACCIITNAEIPIMKDDRDDHDNHDHYGDHDDHDHDGHYVDMEVHVEEEAH